MAPWKIFTVIGLLLAAAVGAVSVAQDSYELEILMPAADGTYVGGKVMMDGHQVGEVTDVGVLDDKALVTVALDDSYAPMPSGTTARVSWESVIGARVVELLPGPQRNPELPAGVLIRSHTERVELDDVLAALNPRTRAEVQTLVGQLNRTLHGREQRVRATVRAAGPTIEAMGAVMRAVGEDGPAIRRLVTNLHSMTSTLAARDVQLARTVQNVGVLTAATAEKQQALTQALGQLPATVRQATATLQTMPRAVDATTPLLRDLRPATRRLPEVAANLSPVLQELRPTVAQLRPTLGHARHLLRYTPGLLEHAHATVPGVNRAVTRLQPATAFLRPYTPELMGWLSNWTGVFASQTSGNYGRALITESGTSLNNNSGVLPPGMQQDPEPAPGSLVGQPWTDANGDAMR